MANIDTFNINGTQYNFPNYRLVVVSGSDTYNITGSGNVFGNAVNWCDNAMKNVFNYVNTPWTSNSISTHEAASKTYSCIKYNNVNAIGGGTAYIHNFSSGQGGASLSASYSYSIAYLEKY